MDFVNACRQLIGIESTPSHGNLDVARACAHITDSMGLSAELFEDQMGGVPQANIIVRGKAESHDGELMLQSHLDTVDPGPYSLWTRTGANPFNATVYQDAIYGLGAADAKLDLLCKLRALAEFKGQKLKKSVAVVGTFGEELGMSGAQRVIRRKLVRPKWALIGEATNLRIVHASKGIAGVEISLPFTEQEQAYKQNHDLQESTSSQSKMFSGRAAHSASPQTGENAIVKMLRHLIQLPTGVAVMSLDGGINFNTVPSHAVYEVDLVSTIKNTVVEKIKNLMEFLTQLELEFANFKDEGFDPAEPTLMIGRIRTFQDQIIIHGNFRWPPCVSDDDYLAWTERLRNLCESLGGRLRLFEMRSPFATPTSADFVRTCQDELSSMGFSPLIAKSSTCTEANLFSRLKIECLTFGPGKTEGNVHTPFEHVLLKDLESAVEFYRRIIKRICL